MPTIRVLVALVATPRRELAEGLDNWLPKAAVIAWLRERGHQTAGLRVGGGFVYEVTARDPYGAADQARQLLDRMIARSSFLRRSRDGIRPTEHVWVEGHSRPVPVAGPARGADVMSLVHEGHLYQVRWGAAADRRRARARGADQPGAVGPAVAGAWAAVESLLAHPDDPSGEERSGKAVAADGVLTVAALLLSTPTRGFADLARKATPPRLRLPRAAASPRPTPTPPAHTGARPQVVNRATAA